MRAASAVAVGWFLGVVLALIENERRGIREEGDAKSEHA